MNKKPRQVGTLLGEWSLPTLMDETVEIDIREDFGIGLAFNYGRDGGASTRLSIGQARAVADQLTRAADAYEQHHGGLES